MSAPTLPFEREGQHTMSSPMDAKSMLRKPLETNGYSHTNEPQSATPTSPTAPSPPRSRVGSRAALTRGDASESPKRLHQLDRWKSPSETGVHLSNTDTNGLRSGAFTAKTEGHASHHAKLGISSQSADALPKLATGSHANGRVSPSKLSQPRLKKSPSQVASTTSVNSGGAASKSSMGSTPNRLNDIAGGDHKSKNAKSDESAGEAIAEDTRGWTDWLIEWINEARTRPMNPQRLGAISTIHFTNMLFAFSIGWLNLVVTLLLLEKYYSLGMNPNNAPNADPQDQSRWVAVCHDIAGMIQSVGVVKDVARIGLLAWVVAMARKPAAERPVPWLYAFCSHSVLMIPSIFMSKSLQAAIVPSAQFISAPSIVVFDLVLTDFPQGLEAVIRVMTQRLDFFNVTGALFNVLSILFHSSRVSWACLLILNEYGQRRQRVQARRLAVRRWRSDLQMSIAVLGSGTARAAFLASLASAQPSLGTKNKASKGSALLLTSATSPLTPVLADVVGGATAHALGLNGTNVLSPAPATQHGDSPSTSDKPSAAASNKRLVSTAANFAREHTRQAPNILRKSFSGILGKDKDGGGGSPNQSNTALSKYSLERGAPSIPAASGQPLAPPIPLKPASFPAWTRLLANQHPSTLSFFLQVYALASFRFAYQLAHAQAATLAASDQDALHFQKLVVKHARGLRIIESKTVWALDTRQGSEIGDMVRTAMLEVAGTKLVKQSLSHLCEVIQSKNERAQYMGRFGKLLEGVMGRLKTGGVQRVTSDVTLSLFAMNPNVMARLMDDLNPLLLRERPSPALIQSFPHSLAELLFGCMWEFPVVKTDLNRSKVACFIDVDTTKITKSKQAGMSNARAMNELLDFVLVIFDMNTFDEFDSPTNAKTTKLKDDIDKATLFLKRNTRTSKVLVVWWNYAQFKSKIQSKQHIGSIAKNLIRVYPSMHRVLKPAPKSKGAGSGNEGAGPGSSTGVPSSASTTTAASTTHIAPSRSPRHTPSLTQGVSSHDPAGAAVSVTQSDSPTLPESSTAASTASTASQSKYLTGRAIQRYFEFKFAKLDHSITVHESTSLFTDEAGAGPCVDAVMHALQARYLVHTLEQANLA